MTSGSGSGFSVVDPAFREIDGQSAGLFVWRIEKLELVRIPRENHGNFFNGDAYIVYHAVRNGEKVGGLGQCLFSNPPINQL